MGARAIQVSAPSALRPSHVGKSMTTSASASPAFFALVGSCLLSGKLVSCVKYSERTPRHLGFVWIYGFMYVYIYKSKICQRSCVCLLTNYLECAAAWDYLESLAALGCLEILSFFAEPEVRGTILGVPGDTFIFGCTWGQGGYLLEGYPISNCSCLKLPDTSSCLVLLGTTFILSQLMS